MPHIASCFFTLLSEGVSCTIAGLAHLATLSTLRMLSMRECSRVAGTGFAAFAALSHSIRSLNLSFCLAFSQPGMPHLATDQFVWSVLAPAVLQIMSDSKADRGSLDLVQAARRWEHYLIWQSWTSACASAWTAACCARCRA